MPPEIAAETLFVNDVEVLKEVGRNVWGLHELRTVIFAFRRKRLVLLKGCKSDDKSDDLDIKVSEYAPLM